MSHDQLIMGGVMPSDFGPRNDFESREWQDVCMNEYAEHVDRFREAFPGFQHRFCLYAGTGSGKTKAAALLACELLNTKVIDQIVFVCPNRSIVRKTRRDLIRYFGIDLVRFNANSHAKGVHRSEQGYILTYAHLMQDPEMHGRICGYKSARTLVIFDEIHHLGDSNGWGDAAKTAFDKVPYVLALTGTPYRSDNTQIPFVTYEDADDSGLKRFRPDFTYSLGQAVSEGVCRKPNFIFHNGEVDIRLTPESDEFRVSFNNTNVNDTVASLRLRGAVRYGAETRKTIIRESLSICREEKRKLIIFLGGDTDGDMTARDDAWNYLPSELQELGITPDEYEVVTGDDDKAQDKIKQFGDSPKWILISINMVSEGTDIPQVSACVFLTSITAKQTTVQRIGRALRYMGPDDPHKDALIFMFADPNMKALSHEIENEILQEIDLRKRRSRAAGSDGEQGDEKHRRAESIGVAGGHAETLSFDGREFSMDEVNATKEMLRVKKMPNTFLHAALLLWGNQNGDRQSS